VFEGSDITLTAGTVGSAAVKRAFPRRSRVTGTLNATAATGIDKSVKCPANMRNSGPVAPDRSGSARIPTADAPARFELQAQGGNCRRTRRGSGAGHGQKPGRTGRGNRLALVR